MNTLCNCFGVTVRQLRESYRWSQETLAEKADLNRSYVGEVERGTVVPSLITIDKIAIAFNIGVPELVRRCEDLRQINAPKKIHLAAIAC